MCLNPLKVYPIIDKLKMYLLEQRKSYDNIPSMFGFLTKLDHEKLLNMSKI